MRGAFKRRLAPVWRGVGLLSASLILSLTTLAPAAAASTMSRQKLVMVRLSIPNG